MPRVEVPLEGIMLERLSGDLAHADPAVMAEFRRAYDAVRKRGLLPLMVARVNGLKIKIWADEHPPPHFRVDYGESASFSILSCERLPGVVGLERHEKVIRRWFEGDRKSPNRKLEYNTPGRLPGRPDLARTGALCDGTNTFDFDRALDQYLQENPSAVRKLRLAARREMAKSAKPRDCAN